MADMSINRRISSTK